MHGVLHGVECSLLHVMLAMERVLGKFEQPGSCPHKLSRWDQMAVTLSGSGQKALLEPPIHFFLFTWHLLPGHP